MLLFPECFPRKKRPFDSLFTASVVNRELELGFLMIIHLKKRLVGWRTRAELDRGRVEPRAELDVDNACTGPRRKGALA